MDPLSQTQTAAPERSKRSSRVSRRRMPVQERGRQRVDQLVGAAERLLGRMPVDEVTASAIAAEAGVPIGSLYQYFPNRLAVLAELMQRGTDRVDRMTIAAIEASYDLPWRKSVDRIVDSVLTNFAELAERPTWQVLVRSVIPSPEFHRMAAESNARVARALYAHPKLSAAVPDPRRRWLIARTTIEAGTGIQSWALAPEADDQPVDVSAIAQEMKTLTAAYLGQYLENSP